MQALDLNPDLSDTKEDFHSANASQIHEVINSLNVQFKMFSQKGVTKEMLSDCGIWS